MRRFFSIAILINWFVVLLYLGAIGFGMGEGSQGMLGATVVMLSAHAIGSPFANLIQPFVTFIAMAVVAAGLWALMAVFFAQSDGSENIDQDFVITSSLGFCLLIFSILLVLSVGFEDAQVGALAAVASFSTLLAGIAQRIYVTELSAANVSQPVPSMNLSMARAASMANQSAMLANAGSRSSRFVPKRPYQP